MIPLWLKIIWNLYGLLIWLYSLYPISGLIVMSLTKVNGNKFHTKTEYELIKACFILIVLFMVWILSFVFIMIIYQIPFNKWIG